MIRRGRRSVPGAALKPEIVRVFAGTFGVYGTRKVRRPMTREGVDAAGCTVERPRRDPGLKGVIGGKPVRTAVSDKAAPCPLDHVNRRFRAPAPIMPQAPDFTHAATWAGFVRAAFAIGVYARYIVGRPTGLCRMPRSRPSTTVAPSVGAALCIMAIGVADTYLSNTPGARPKRGSSPRSAASGTVTTTPWPKRSTGSARPGRSAGESRGDPSKPVECATLEWVDRFNDRRLPQPIGNIPN